MSYYEVWEFRSANLVATFSSEAEALTLVRELLATGDPGYRTELGLAEIRDDGSDGRVLEGEALVRRAEAELVGSQRGPV